MAQVSFSLLLQQASRSQPKPRQIYALILIFFGIDLEFLEFIPSSNTFFVDIIRSLEFPLLGERNWICEKSLLICFLSVLPPSFPDGTKD